MIQIQSKDTQLIVRLFAGYPISEWEFTTTGNMQYEAYALLVAHNIREYIDKRIRSIREDEYNKGWKDAKAKKAKRTWFSCQWGVQP